MKRDGWIWLREGYFCTLLLVCLPAGGTGTGVMQQVISKFLT